MEQQKCKKLLKLTSQPGGSYTQNALNQNIPSFLLKTYQILENNKYSDIISWTKNGQGFIVKKVKQFSQTILPIYFRHNNYTSFVRQLNMYDFHKTRQQNQQNAFKNFLFKKGHKYLLKQIQRKDYKKNKESNKEMWSNLILEKNQKKQTDNLEKTIQVYTKAKENNQNISPQNNNLLLSSNECFKMNINQLKKSKNQLEQKSSKLMGFKQTEFSSQMILKAIDVLFECGMANHKIFCEMELLRTDFELNQRKNYFSSFKEKIKGQQKKMESHFENTQIKNLGNYQETGSDVKTILFNTSDPKTSLMNGFERYEPTQVSLFSSFRNQ